MSKFLKVALGLLTWTVMLPGLAQAQDRIVDVSSIASVAKLLQETGYKAEIKKQKNGESYIASAANGNNFSIYFYGCKQDVACESFEFYSWYKKEPGFTPALANEWNAKKRFLKIAVDADGDLAEYLYVSAIGQMSYKNFADYVDWYTTMDGELSKFLKEKQDAAK